MYQIKKTNKKFTGKNIVKTFLSLLFVFLFIFLFNHFNFISSLTANTLSPFFKTGNFVYDNLNRIPKIFTDKNKIIEENTKLLFELEDLKISIIDYEALKYENKQLKESLNLKPVGDFISASIIAKPPQTPLDSLFIDIGLNDGVKNGDLILGSERVLVGKVVEISNNKAIVTLNSFARLITYGFVSRTNEPIEINGAGGGSIEATVPIDFDVEVGDKIIVSDSLNYVAAIVGVVEKDTSSGLKNILMSLPLNISKINIVYIKSHIDE